jgi:hypothetical protein
MEAGCGHVQPCPNPPGDGCSPDATSCFDVAGPPAPVPVLSMGGLLIAAVLIGAAGWLTLARRAQRR